MLLVGPPAPSGAARGIILPMFSIVRFILLLLLTTIPLAAQQPWHFAVSGDSRDCGDVVMPAIAAGAHRDHAAFYWHLGDFRAIYDFDQDYRQLATAGGSPLLIIDYENRAWDDFIDNQLTPFGDTPVYLTIGNHETIPPKTRSDFLIQFADWLDTPELKLQRLKDNAKDHRLKTYYHWQQEGVDFINLDNASPDQFDKEQLEWLERVLHADAGDPSIPTIVVGMHAALPESLAKDHSMSDTQQGEASGRGVYAELLDARNHAHKNIYVLASHSHYLMDGVYNTDYWRHNGGVLPGWIVGTAGAVRYPLPSNAGDAKAAKTNIYGYLLGTVNRDRTIDFRFQQIEETSVPPQIVSRFGRNLVHDCFAANRQ
jgi:Calcineurin-like phosphoesterase